jgi:2-polyprenyl-3-methyl-5-hydroxy-6-metoxy-1,4-benzoquinol methylase
LSKKQKELNIVALKYLLNFFVDIPKGEEQTARKNELIKICLKHNIQIPIIGEKKYDPKQDIYSNKA